MFILESNTICALACFDGLLLVFRSEGGFRNRIIRVPDPMIWDRDSEYPGVREFAMRMKEAIMTAHDAVIAARVKQTHYANKRRRLSEFMEGNFVYLSTENLNLPKGRARKLVPKYIGPYKIKAIKSPGASYELELPRELQIRGIHPVFHASLLRPHVPSDD